MSVPVEYQNIIMFQCYTYNNNNNFVYYGINSNYILNIQESYMSI